MRRGGGSFRLARVPWRSKGVFFLVMGPRCREDGVFIGCGVLLVPNITREICCNNVIVVRKHEL